MRNIVLLSLTLLLFYGNILITSGRQQTLSQRRYLNNDCISHQMEVIDISDDLDVTVSLQSGSVKIFSFDIDDNKDDLEFVIDSNKTVNITAQLVPNPYLLTQNTSIVFPSDGRTHWEVIIDSDTIKLYNYGKILLEVYNPQREEVVIRLQISFKVSLFLIYFLIISGSVALIGTSSLGLFYLMKNKRRIRERLVRMGVLKNLNTTPSINNNVYGIEDQKGSKIKKENLTSENINVLFPETKFQSLINHFMHKDCSICLENFESDSFCRQLRCQHIFHSECIRVWMEVQLMKGMASCPNCNKDMAKMITI